MANSRRAFFTTTFPPSSQFDNELTTLYDVGLDATPGHIQFNGVARAGVRLDAGAGGLNAFAKSVWVRFRKYGNPTGNTTVGIRKAANDSLVTILGNKLQSVDDIIGMLLDEYDRSHMQEIKRGKKAH